MERVAGCVALITLHSISDDCVALAAMPAGGRTKLENPGLAEIFTRFYCNYCNEELYGLRVSCAYCTDFDLCPECFASGAELGGHKNHHKYFFSNNGNFSIFPKESCFNIVGP